MSSYKPNRKQSEASRRPSRLATMLGFKTDGSIPDVKRRTKSGDSKRETYSIEDAGDTIPEGLTSKRFTKMDRAMLNRQSHGKSEFSFQMPDSLQNHSPPEPPPSKSMNLSKGPRSTRSTNGGRSQGSNFASGRKKMGGFRKAITTRIRKKKQKAPFQLGADFTVSNLKPMMECLDELPQNLMVSNREVTADYISKRNFLNSAPHDTSELDMKFNGRTVDEMLQEGSYEDVEAYESDLRDEVADQAAEEKMPPPSYENGPLPPPKHPKTSRIASMQAPRKKEIVRVSPHILEANKSFVMPPPSHPPPHKSVVLPPPSHAPPTDL